MTNRLIALLLALAAGCAQNPGATTPAAPVTAATRADRLPNQMCVNECLGSTASNSSKGDLDFCRSRCTF